MRCEYSMQICIHTMLTYRYYTLYKIIYNIRVYNVLILIIILYLPF